MDNSVLIVVVILLAVLIYFEKSKASAKCGADGGASSGASSSGNGASGSAAAKAAEGMSAHAALNRLNELQAKIKDPESYAQREQLEGFAVCRDPDEISKVLDCVCGDDPATTFAQYDYGKPGLDYKGYVTSQAVDAAVIHNHLQFVHGPNGAYSTGRTYSPDSHESYDPIPWVGLRRPEYVVQCNPTQVPDVNLDMFKRNRQFCFQT
jgi:hypothetical protein